MDTDGADLIVRAAAGDRAAFEAFVRRWERPLHRFLERALASSHLAEEARQTTFVRVLERGRSFRGATASEASTWLFRVAWNVALDLRRRERLRRTSPLDDDAPLADVAPGPADAAARTEGDAFVREALARMDAEDRALLWLRVADGRTFASVARTLGLAESTVRLRFVRALGRLRRQLHAGSPGEVRGDRWTATRS